MNPIDLERFTACLPAIKINWLNRLQNEPSTSALGRRETVEFLMDATLMQLTAGLATRLKDQGVERRMPLALMAHRYCACALEPISRYYSTGEEALRTVLQPTSGEPWKVVFINFRATLDFEIAAMCAECTHPDWIGCKIRSRPSPAG
ncbi:MAG: hypothetical protein ABI273_03925 [Lacunisphaera sp.]